MHEQEAQVEAIKGFLRQYGMSILIGICLALMANLGWQKWQSHQENTREAAAMAYHRLLYLQTKQHTAKASAQAHQLISDYPQTPYASLAQLWLAKEAAVKKDWAGAESAYQWTLNHHPMPAIKGVALSQLARVYAIEKKSVLLKTTIDNLQVPGFGHTQSFLQATYLHETLPPSRRDALPKPLQWLLQLHSA